MQALLESALAAKERAQLEAIDAARRQASEDTAYAQARLDERLQAQGREHAASLHAQVRVHEGELQRMRELHAATVGARERAFEAQLGEVSSLHKAQLEAYSKIEEQGGRRMVKVAVLVASCRPPRAPQAASEGPGRPSAPVRSDPPPPVPLRGRVPGARPPRPRRHFRCV